MCSVSSVKAQVAIVHIAADREWLIALLVWEEALMSAHTVKEVEKSGSRQLRRILQQPIAQKRFILVRNAREKGVQEYARIAAATAGMRIHDRSVQNVYIPAKTDANDATDMAC